MVWGEGGRGGKIRAKKVCSGGKQWQEIQRLRQVFMANGYPGPVMNNLRGKTTPTITTVETPPKLLHRPYVKKVSEWIEKICQSLE